MKRISFILFTLCFTSVSIYAQGEDDDTSTTLNTTFGIKAGYNATQMKVVNESSENIQREAGVYFGAFINIPTSETFSVQPELLYSSSRFNINDNINVLHIPVSLKIQFGE